MPGTVKCVPSCSISCTFAGSVKTPVSRSRDDGVVLPGALPELVEHLEVLVGDVVAVVVLQLVVVAHVARARTAGSR